MKKDDVFIAVSYIDELTELEAFTRLSSFALEFEARREEVEKKYNEKSDNNNEIDSRSFTYNSPFLLDEHITEFAKSQFNNGFTYVYEIATIRIWSVLEAAVDDLALYALHNIPTARNSEFLSKLKGPLLEFIALDVEQQAEYLLELIKSQANPTQKLGIGQFDIVLDNLNLGGVLDKTVRTTLFELSQVRNVLVHCNGKADKRLKKNCPWLNTEIGNRVVITPYHYYAYHCAALLYLDELTRRQLIVEGEENFLEEPEFQKAQANYLKRLKKYVSHYRSP
jgi:hypothetical protein